MIDILTASIGIGLAVSLLFSEMFGLAAGGMVVPGYIALYLNRPIDIALTLAAALVTYFDRPLAVDVHHHVRQAAHGADDHRSATWSAGCSSRFRFTRPIRCTASAEQFGDGAGASSRSSATSFPG